MVDMDDIKYQKIAYHLITFWNQKARRNLEKNYLDWGDFFNLPSKDLTDLGFSKSELSQVRSYKRIASKEIERANKNQIHIIFKGDAFYPTSLAEIYQPPEFIYARGKRQLLMQEKLAVVGSRKPTVYGLRSMDSLLPGLIDQGLTIVSGMAYGIDSRAHRIALERKGGTIGVNAGGLFHLYPKRNSPLINQLLEEGCVISEFPLDVVPRPFFFPIRNRIVAGISRGVLVIEAALKSGSLITARLGLEQNKDIFALPGRIDSPMSEGTHFLIQQGAKLVGSYRDILEEFGVFCPEDPSMEIQNFSKKEKKILDLMVDNEVKSVDYFVENVEYSVPDVLSILMGLVLRNILVSEAGGYRKR